MRRHYLIPALLLAALAGCTQLNAEDKALLVDTHNAAQEARDNSARSAQEASAARVQADKASAEASAAADKANRIFERGSEK
jgi:hypothetical protein